MMQFPELVVNWVHEIPEIVEVQKHGIRGELLNPSGQTK